MMSMRMMTHLLARLAEVSSSAAQLLLAALLGPQGLRRRPLPIARTHARTRSRS